jgi:hypothetical protein
LFEDRRGRNKKELIGREELERKIGQLTIELDF